MMAAFLSHFVCFVTVSLFKVISQRFSLPGVLFKQEDHRIRKDLLVTEFSSFLRAEKPCPTVESRNMTEHNLHK